MITISLPYKTENVTDLDLLRKQYSNVVRFSYNRFLENKSQKDIRNLVKGLNNIDLNSWLIQCGIKEGEANHKKNKEDKVIFGGKKLYPSLNSVKDHWKKYLTQGFKTWKEFFEYIKNSKLKYRVSLNREFNVLSQLSKKSKIDYFSYPI